MNFLSSRVLFVPSFVDFSLCFINFHLRLHMLWLHLSFVYSTFQTSILAYTSSFHVFIYHVTSILGSPIICLNLLTYSSLVHNFTIYDFSLPNFFSCLSFFFSCVLLSWFSLNLIGSCGALNVRVVPRFLGTLHILFENIEQERTQREWPYLN